MEDEKNEDNLTFISFIDDDGVKKDKWVKLVSKNSYGVEFELGDKIITLPWQRILKIKEEKENES